MWKPNTRHFSRMPSWPPPVIGVECQQANSTTIAAARSGTIVQAYGGLPTDPFGTWTDRAGAQHAMWGTSFAAAVVTASYLS